MWSVIAANPSERVVSVLDLSVFINVNHVSGRLQALSWDWDRSSMLVSDSRIAQVVKKHKK